MFGHKLVSEKDLEKIAAMQQQYESTIAALTKKVEDLEAGIRSGRKQMGITSEEHMERATELLGNPKGDYMLPMILASRKEGRGTETAKDEDNLEDAIKTGTLEHGLKRYAREIGFGPVSPIELEAGIRVEKLGEDPATAVANATEYWDGVIRNNSRGEINSAADRINAIYDF